MSPSRRWPTALRKAWPFEILPTTQWSRQTPTHRDASPSLIAAALARSQRRPSGNWFAAAASTDVRTKPVRLQVGGAEVVCWRDGRGALRAGPAACPHLGADLCTGTVDRGQLVCPWHGMRFTGRSVPNWESVPVYDDGVLVWLRLDRIGTESPTEAPILPARPGPPTIPAVTRIIGACEPADVIANRMDPWHGAWFHPYSFARLEVLDAPAEDSEPPAELDRFLVAVTFHVGRLGVPVIAEFTSPEPRTLVMRIVEGEGAGSVVETHATPLKADTDGTPRTLVLEAVIAHSDRPGFAQALRVTPVIAPFMRRAAHRLWRDDIEYAERLHTVRRQEADGDARLLRPPASTATAPPPPAAEPDRAPTD